jgi:hypothetical protein
MGLAMLSMTGSLAEQRLKRQIFLPLASRKNNNLNPFISYIATRITLDPRVWFLRVVLQHNENTHMEAPKLKRRLRKGYRKKGALGMKRSEQL